MSNNHKEYFDKQVELLEKLVAEVQLYSHHAVWILSSAKRSSDVIEHASKNHELSESIKQAIYEDSLEEFSKQIEHSFCNNAVRLNDLVNQIIAYRDSYVKEHKQ